MADKPATTKKFLAIAVVLAVAIVGAMELGERYFALPSLDITPVEEQEVAVSSNGSTSGTALVGGPFELTAHDGRTITDKDFPGKFKIMYFGYTYCPDICPAALYNISGALEKMGQVSKRFQPIFVTVDPERDTLEQLKIYQTNFNRNFLMLTGSKEKTDALAKAYRVYHRKAKPDGTTSEYLIDHSSVVYIMNPKGELVAHFNHATPSSEIYKILKRLI